MEAIIKKKGIDLEMIKDSAVTQAALSQVARNGCSIWKEASRIGDIVPKEDPRQAYKSLQPWQQELMKILAHSSCMQRNGKWSKKQQDAYITNEFDKVSTPSGFNQDSLVPFIKDNLGVLGMLDASMRKTPDCSLPFSWRP